MADAFPDSSSAESSHCRTSTYPVPSPTSYDTFVVEVDLLCTFPIRCICHQIVCVQRSAHLRDFLTVNDKVRIRVNLRSVQNLFDCHWSEGRIAFPPLPHQHGMTCRRITHLSSAGRFLTSTLRATAGDEAAPLATVIWIVLAVCIHEHLSGSGYEDEMTKEGRKEAYNCSWLFYSRSSHPHQRKSLVTRQSREQNSICRPNCRACHKACGNSKKV